MPSEETQSNVPDSEAEWRATLSDEEYEILREKGTEPPGSGDLLHVDEEGRFSCAGCGAELFRTDQKYDSGSGWPSFWDAVDPERIETHPDHSLGMIRTEICCASCGGHLGHLFDDGPKPTGKRYCVNSLSLDFEPDE